MDSAFGWLGQVMDAVICIFPRREVLEDTHGGVRYRFGKREELPTDGRVLWYWPLVTKIRTYPHILQTCNLENQTLTTKDGHTIGLIWRSYKAWRVAITQHGTSAVCAWIIRFGTTAIAPIGQLAMG
jgi:hypothetical protein